MKPSKNSASASPLPNRFATNKTDMSSCARPADFQIKSGARPRYLSAPRTPEIINFVPPATLAEEVAYEPPEDLGSHRRQLRRRNQSAPRWLALAVLTGAVVALAFVRFLARRTFTVSRGPRSSDCERAAGRFNYFELFGCAEECSCRRCWMRCSHSWRMASAFVRWSGFSTLL
jgi:hypothetical protein